MICRAVVYVCIILSFNVVVLAADKLFVVIQICCFWQYLFFTSLSTFAHGEHLTQERALRQRSNRPEMSAIKKEGPTLCLHLLFEFSNAV